MLQNIRQKITGPMALVVLALLCIPFIFVGYNYGGMTQAGFAVKVNGQEIPARQIRVAYQNQAARIREQLDEIPPALAQQHRSPWPRPLVNTSGWHLLEMLGTGFDL